MFDRLNARFHFTLDVCATPENAKCPVFFTKDVDGLAQYWPAGTMDASHWDNPPEDWWDESGDKCTNPEPGWYEAQIETETNYLLTGVSHWMPLPPSPNTKSSQPGT